VHGRGLGVTPLAFLGEDHVDAPPVLAAQGPLDQAVLFQPVDQPGQGALAEVDCVGQFLGSSKPP